MRPAPLVKQECSKHMDIEEQAPVKTLIIHFDFIFGQISMARRLLKILYISSTITTVTIHFISINFAVLWNARFFNIFYKIHWSNVFFVFYTFFLKIKIFFASFLFSLPFFKWPTYFLLSKIRIVVISSVFENVHFTFVQFSIIWKRKNNRLCA